MAIYLGISLNIFNQCFVVFNTRSYVYFVRFISNISLFGGNYGWPLNNARVRAPTFLTGKFHAELIVGPRICAVSHIHGSASADLTNLGSCRTVAFTLKVSGLVQFKPVLFRGQLYYHFFLNLFSISHYYFIETQLTFVYWSCILWPCEGHFILFF